MANGDFHKPREVMTRHGPFRPSPIGASPERGSIRFHLRHQGRRRIIVETAPLAAQFVIMKQKPRSRRLSFHPRLAAHSETAGLNPDGSLSRAITPIREELIATGLAHRFRARLRP